MAAPKPLASLSSGLLARPGTAKPAMRPQAFTHTNLEDLGWNDMGTAPVAPTPTATLRPAVQLSQPPVVPAPVSETVIETVSEPVSEPMSEPAVAIAPVPPVLAERAKLAGAVARSKSRAKPVAAAATAARKAAFTLRLDSDRHLRLRLASAVHGRSSQLLVVEALDAFLSAQPEVEALARQLPANPVAEK